MEPIFAEKQFISSWPQPQRMTEDDKKNIKSIFAVFDDMFAQAGIIPKYHNEVIIYMIQKFGVPKFHIENNIPCISLCIKGSSYYCQVAYQMSHEMTHFLIYDASAKKNPELSWLEETICEAISIYALRYLADHWKKCELSNHAPNYDIHIRQYIDDLISQTGTRSLSNCKSIAEMKMIEKESCKKRELRRTEMLELSNTIQQKNIKGLIHYRQFCQMDSLFLDYKKYARKYKRNESVTFIKKLHKHIRSNIRQKNISDFLHPSN